MQVTAHTIFLDEFITQEYLPALYDAGKSVKLDNDYPDREESFEIFYTDTASAEIAELTTEIISKELTSLWAIVDHIEAKYRAIHEETAYYSNVCKGDMHRYNGVSQAQFA